MTDNPLTSLLDYSQYVAELLNHSSVEHSTLIVWSDSPYTGIAEGEIFFKKELKVRIREELDFDAGLIASYGYEVYQRGERLYWYDDFAHPNDPKLASTFPHHKHVHPDIKHNRIPAKRISFSRPNLAVIIYEIEELLKMQTY